MSTDASDQGDVELYGVGAADAGYDGGNHDDDADQDDIDRALLDDENDNGADNAVKSDGTRERNLTLWEAAQWRQKIFSVFESGSFPSDVPQLTERIAFVWAIFMFVVIVLSSATVLIESYPEYRDNEVPSEIAILEVFAVVIFSFDMIVRLISCPSQLNYLIDPYNWIDLLAILPFYLTDIGGVDFLPELRMVRTLRLVRMLRVLRSRRLPGLNQMITALQTSMDGLVLFIALAGIALLIASTSAYYAERGQRDEASELWYRQCPINRNCTHRMGEISPFQSIPDSFWWGTSALSTVGFGDVTPLTPLGKFVACLTMLAGVYILAFPTMILSGNFDAARKFGTIVNYGWDISSIIKEKRNVDSPRTQILMRLGWYDEDQLMRNEAEAIAAPDPDTAAAAFGETNAGLAAGASAPAQQRRRRKKRTGPQPVGAFIAHNLPRYVYRESSVDEHQHWYDPVLSIAACDDGGPSARVIWGTCGQPTIVQFTIVLDSVEVREEAIKIVEGFDANGKVKCELGNGIEVKHFNSAKKPGDAAFEMLPSRITGAYRNSDLPLYFKWTGHEADLMMMSEDEVAELAVSSLLGTSLHVSVQVPVAPVIKRLAIVQQVIHHTRLQRELELIARPIEYGGDLMAYIARPDVEALLEGVSAKVIVDPSLAFEDVHRLEQEIITSVLDRVREMRKFAVPKMAADAIYNGPLLGPHAPVYEFPMSLFQADEADEVEEDALGYSHARMKQSMCRTYRLDIRVDNAPDDLGYEEDEAMGMA